MSLRAAGFFMPIQSIKFDMSFSIRPVRLSYSYDGVGNIETITDKSYGTLSQTYTYDPMDRLKIKSDRLGNQCFTYDANGNRLTQTR